MSKATKTKERTLFGDMPKEAPKPKPPAVSNPAKPKAAVVALRKDTPANTLSVIAEALKDPNFKPENMRLVLDMHREMVAEQARLDFIAAFHAMRRELPVINKDGRIVITAKEGGVRKSVAEGGRVQQDTPYATYENIREVIDPIIDRHGFSVDDETEPSADGRLLVRTKLTHVGGHVRQTTFPLPAETSGSKNNVQGWGSTTSYGRRYNIVNLLSLRSRAPEDRDLDGNAPRRTKGGKPQAIDGGTVIEGGVAEVDPEPKCSQDQLDRLREAIEGCGVSTATFVKHYGIEKVSDLPADRYDDAMMACKQYAERRR